ncbi:type II secretion system protein [Candidatus Falkowbacteria bacterium]|nr:type II secretion system protein [Candidatus Falkowbacteria bacterium]NCT54365.1 type II secretion system protein [Candidatus Falkowbacteria bacterium]
MHKSKKAFTLIELLVVIAIIGLLSTLSVIALNSARAKSRDAKRISDVKQMQLALEMYFDDMADYPPMASAGAAIVAASTTFLRVIPVPPIPIDGDLCNSGTNSNYDKDTYKYTRTATGARPSYVIGFCLGSDVGSGVTKITGNMLLYMTPAGISWN